jgi:hypothetical protein
MNNIIFYKEMITLKATNIFFLFFYFVYCDVVIFFIVVMRSSFMMIFSLSPLIKMYK